jgi:hypothetical protein
MGSRSSLRSGSLLATILGIAITVFWLVATLTWPFGWDQGIFAWVGSVIRDGGMPYRDAVDVKGPLPYYVYALAQVLFGDNTWGIRALDAIAVVAGAIALRSVVSKFAASPIGTWAGCALVLWMGSLGFWSTAQADGWVAVLMTIAVAALFATPSRALAVRVVLAGALAGTAALVKPFYFGFVFLGIAWLWLPSIRWTAANAPDNGADHAVTRSERLVISVLTLLAAALPVALMAGWLALHGALDDAIDVHLRFTAESYSGVGDLAIVARVRGLLDLASRIPALLFALPAMVAGIVAAWRIDRPRAALLAIWAAMAIAFIVLQNRFYLYQALPAFPPLVVFAVIGFRAIWSATSSANSDGARQATTLRVFAIAHLVLVLISLLDRPALDLRRAVRYVAGSISEETYLWGFAPMGSFNAADELAMARALRSRSDSSDRVAIIGYNAGILYLADRRSPSRFGPSVPYTHEAGTPLTRRFQDEFIAAFETTPPEWVVVGAIDGAALSLESRLSSFPRLATLLEAQYCMEEQVGHYVLFSQCARS